MLTLKNKTSNYFTSKVGLFGNNRGIAIPDKYGIAKTTDKSSKQRRGTLQRKRNLEGVVSHGRPLKESKRGCPQFLTG